MLREREPYHTRKEKANAETVQCMEDRQEIRSLLRSGLVHFGFFPGSRTPDGEPNHGKQRDEGNDDCKFDEREQETDQHDQLLEQRHD